MQDDSIRKGKPKDPVIPPPQHNLRSNGKPPLGSSKPAQDQDRFAGVNKGQNGVHPSGQPPFDKGQRGFLRTNSADHNDQDAMPSKPSPFLTAKQQFVRTHAFFCNPPLPHSLPSPVSCKVIDKDKRFGGGAASGGQGSSEPTYGRGKSLGGRPGGHELSSLPPFSNPKLIHFLRLVVAAAVVGVAFHPQ